ncbi:restriction endonuclease subunit S [Ureaplasma diversum]|uniref:Type I restriction modification system specificity (S) subunit n=1 Tax=Ureaplasma diversum NCTC 246 TaxID=1188241 RepID=A0A084EX40_9BACT|nr:restriction endonuclease subunit S [Ureaplasma diversum]KEZ22532.1 Type I restriction modification system specificity (S) subunit [Ureaplasma diversum NCTC 246]
MENILELIKNEKVKWKRLGEVCEIKKGQQLNKKLLKDDEMYPAYNGGKTFSGRTNKYNVEADTIIISQGGASAGFVNFITERFWANAHCFYLLHYEIVDNKFLYHWLKLNEDYLMSVQYGAGIPALSKEVISNILVPVPSLEVQEKIAKTLDKFTKYVTELLLRNKQYNYYRNFLLSDEFLTKKTLELCGKDAEIVFKKLGEIGEFFGGLTGKTKQHFIDGNQKYVTYKNVFSNLTPDLDTLEDVLINENEKQKKLEIGDIIFTSSSENLEEAGVSSVITKLPNYDVYLNSFCFFLRLNDKNILSPEYSKFLFRSNEMRKNIIKVTSGVTRFNVSRKLMGNISIPIPLLPVQNHIVSILDQFNTLTNNLSEGLPKEIELRQKQYEYYREQLLSFNSNQD